MIVILSNVCILIVILLYFTARRVHNVTGIAVVYPVTWITTYSCMIVFYIICFKKIDNQ